MSDEDRRAVGNLMLMCYRHHVATNDVDAFPVSRLRDMKAGHEKRFSAGIDDLVTRVQDQTETTVVTPARTLRAFHEHHRLNLDAEDTAESVTAMLEFAEQIRGLSVPARETLAIILERGREIHDGGDVEYAVMFREIMDVTRMGDDIVVARLEQLSERGLVRAEYEDPSLDEFPGPYAATTSGDKVFWCDIRSYCRAFDIPLTQIVVDLRFDLLDAPLQEDNAFVGG